MSYSPSLTYFLDRLSGFSTNIFRLEPQNQTTANPNQIIRFTLPSNALLNIRTFALHFSASAEGTNAGARLPAKIDSLIERVEITAGGVQLSQGLNFYNVLRHAKDALYGDKTNSIFGHPEILRTTRRNEVPDASVNFLPVAHSNIMTGTGNETYESTNGQTQFCIDHWEGFLGTCEPKILDASILPDLVISIYLTGSNVVTSSSGTDLPDETRGKVTVAAAADPTSATAITAAGGAGNNALSDAPALASFTAAGAGGATFSLSNIHATIETIGLADAVYDNLVASMISQKGFVEVPFKQYVSFNGIHTGVTRFTVATQSLDRIWVCWRANSATNANQAPFPVVGHKVGGAWASAIQNIGSNTAGGIFTNVPLGRPVYTEGSLDTLTEKYTSPYFNFREPEANANTKLTHQLQLNGAYYPQFPATAEELAVISKHSCLGMNNLQNKSLAQYKTNYFVQCFRLNMNDSEYSRTQSGLDTRSVALNGYLNTANLNVGSANPMCTIFAECTSTLRIGAGRMLEVIM